MVTYTVKTAYALHEAMSDLIKNGVTIKGKAGLVFAYNYRLIHEAMSEYITRRDGIITKYADPIDEETKKKNEVEGIIYVPSITDPDNFAKANKEIDEFSALKIEIPIMEISLEDISNTPDIDFYISNMLLLFCKEYNSDVKKIKTQKKK